MSWAWTGRGGSHPWWARVLWLGIPAALAACGGGPVPVAGADAPTSSDAQMADIKSLTDVDKPPLSDTNLVADGSADAGTAADELADAAGVEPPDGEADSSEAETAGDGAAAECAAAVDCPAAQGACQVAVCQNGQCGTVAVADTQSCDDADPCTVEDQCLSGSCIGAPNLACACGPSKPCADDGNLCTSPPTCDMSVFPPVCVTNPSKDIQCNTAMDDACEVSACNPTTGKCQTYAVGQTQQVCAPAGQPCWAAPLPPGVPPKLNLPCDDGNACTAGESCTGASCGGGTWTCLCGPALPCPDDGNLCNGVPFCDITQPGGKCVSNPASVVVCPTADDSVCQQNTCNPKNGQCAMKAVVTASLGCDDGNPCTSGDFCDGGLCVASANTCVCTKDADCAPQEDGNLCNGTLYCNLAANPPTCQINPASVTKCNVAADTDCLRTVCVPKTGVCAQLPAEQTVKSDPACQAGCAWVPKDPATPAPIVPCEGGGKLCSGGFCGPP